MKIGSKALLCIFTLHAFHDYLLIIDEEGDIDRTGFNSFLQVFYSNIIILIYSECSYL